MTDLETITEKPNRMARRRAKTRQTLLDMAVELVVERGFDETTTDAISEAADVGRRTFYNHFDNKRDCVLAALKTRYSEFAARAATPAERHKDPALTLATSAYQVFNRICADSVTQQLVDYPQLLAEAVEESQRQFLLRDFISGLSQERFKPVHPLEIMTPVLLWGFVGLVIDTIQQESEHENGSAWAGYVLYNLGINQEEIDTLLRQVKETE